MQEGWANKGVSVQAGNYTAVFDPEKLCFVDAWEGGLPEWGSRRYGITSGVKAKGKKVGGFPSGKWTFPEKIETKYLGFYRAKVGPSLGIALERRRSTSGSRERESSPINGLSRENFQREWPSPEMILYANHRYPI
jgi:hypothetical protein